MVPEVVQRMRERYFRAAIEAAWTQPRCGDRLVGGRLGSNAHVATPFHCDYGYNVYISDCCVVGAGVRVGDGAVIRSGSIVVHDIPPNYIACGSPANTYEAN